MPEKEREREIRGHLDMLLQFHMRKSRLGKRSDLLKVFRSGWTVVQDLRRGRAELWPPAGVVMLT